MTTRIESHGKFIREHIITEIENGDNCDSEEYNNIIDYSIDELMKINIRKTARENNVPFPKKDILNEAIEMTKSSLLEECRVHNLTFEINQYFDDKKTKFGPLANEISKLKQELLSSKEGSRIGNTLTLKTDDQFSYEIVEIGLKESVDGLILTPVSEEFQVAMVKLHHDYDVIGEWFPFEIRIDYLTFILDDDGTMFVSTENYPQNLLEEAKNILEKVASDIYTNICN